jgi:hypothetical protein
MRKIFNKTISSSFKINKLIFKSKIYQTNLHRASLILVTTTEFLSHFKHFRKFLYWKKNFFKENNLKSIKLFYLKSGFASKASPMSFSLNWHILLLAFIYYFSSDCIH